MQELTSVTVQSYPRIHLGLLDLSGTSMRVDGGVGLSVSAFPITVSVCGNAFTQIISQSVDARRICMHVLTDMKEILPHTCVQITIKTKGILHCGLGFATQCLFSVAQALLKYFKLDISKEDLAQILHRGGTSGIGVHSFYRGGFLVDGGHAFPKDKDAFAPTSQCHTRSIPPLITWLPFPNWSICVAIPKAQKPLCGLAEIEFWRTATPVPVEESRILCHNLLMGMLPAIAESDFHNFCYAIQISATNGMKKREIAYWQPMFGQCSTILEKNGWQGITLSSLGPAIVGFAEHSETVMKTRSALENSGLFSSITITTAQNSGFEILT
jgi:beta-ribofuranosylaminobenzene 5'-phosphate synthase